jgi:HEAT repeat protein
MLPRKRERYDDYMKVLIRTGEDGADALIEQLTSAQSLTDRRIYFDALVTLNAGIPALIHMLGDARWYVARNAADLLGEMVAEEALGPLSELLKHDDDRVRRAAITALAKLTSPKAVDALRTALRDSSAQVRMQAAAGMGARKGMRTAATLTKALDDEEDADVQLAIIGSLGRLATTDAVQRLIKLAEPGALFKKKPTAIRVAAVQALGEARTPAAHSALQHLVHDKEKEVSQAVFRLLLPVGKA